LRFPPSVNIGLLQKGKARRVHFGGALGAATGLNQAGGSDCDCEGGRFRRASRCVRATLYVVVLCIKSSVRILAIVHAYAPLCLLFLRTTQGIEPILNEIASPITNPMMKSFSI